MTQPGLIHPGEFAPDFCLLDILEQPICLSDYRGRPVLLAFLRGFM